MKKSVFKEKLPIVLEALKEGINNEIENYYDFNFNSYDDLVDKEFDEQIINIFKRYVEAIELISMGKGVSFHYKTIINALDDYGNGGYHFCEDDDEGYKFEETPFANKQEMDDFIRYLKKLG